MTRALLERCLQTLTLPCDRWNGVQAKIVNSTVEAIRKELAKPAQQARNPYHNADSVVYGPEYMGQTAQQERKPDEWAPYLKDGETPFERFKRERADLDALMTLYRRTLEAQKERKPHTEAEVQELRHASYYTVELGDFEATVRRILGVPAP